MFARDAPARQASRPQKVNKAVFFSSSGQLLLTQKAERSRNRQSAGSFCSFRNPHEQSTGPRFPLRNIPVE
jgi:hypothetical protein